MSYTILKCKFFKKTMLSILLQKKILIEIIKTWFFNSQMIQKPNLLHWHNKKDPYLGKRWKILLIPETHSFMRIPFWCFKASRPINSWDSKYIWISTVLACIFYLIYLITNWLPTKPCQKDLLIKTLKELQCQYYS